MRRPAARPLLVAVGVLLLLLVSGCDGGRAGSAGAGGTAAATTSPTGAGAGCAKISRNLVAAVQRYVDAYGRPASKQRPKAITSTAPDDETLQSAMRGAGQALQSRGCDFGEFEADFREGLATVHTEGPVARAVLLRLTATLTGTARQTPGTVTVRPGDDLPARVAELAAGSVVRLSAGTYRLATPLALLEGVTLRGAGRGRTVVETRAADAGILVLTDGRVELRSLTLRHRGPMTGDLVVGGPTASLVLTDVAMHGARSARDGQGGSAVLMTAPSGTTAERGTTLEVTGAHVTGNAAAGIMLTGGHVASIRRSRFSDNAECGVCFVDASGGAVRGSEFVDNRVGVAVLGRSRPVLADSRFEGGAVAMQASGRARPVVRDIEVTGSGRAAIVFSDRSRGRVDRARCVDVPFGIVVARDALPFLGENDCSLARGE